MRDNVSREMGLGPYPDVSLQRAREKAQDARRLKLDGKDPLEARNEARAAARLEAAKAMSFKEAAEQYIEAQKAGWKNGKHAAQWTSTLKTYVYPIIGNLPIGGIDTPLVSKVLLPIWSKKAETASRVRQRIESVLNWATAHGYRQGANPARWRGHLKETLPKRSKVRRVKHHPALPYAELPAFMSKLNTEREGMAPEALRFTILTAARTGETIGAQWPEIDFAKEIWIVPAGRIKAERDHRVPLSKPALAILKSRHEATGGQGFIFPGPKPKRHLSNMAMLTLLGRMRRDDITVHGFRSTFRDWVEEETSFAGSVAEAALAHVVGDETEAAYRRGDLFLKRTKLMHAWASYCESKPGESKVIQMRKVK